MLKILKMHRALFTPAFVVSAFILIIIAASAVFAFVLAPYDPEKLDLANQLSGISSEHIFGTDKAGRDIFSRILYGGRTTLLSSLAVILISVVVGIPTGLFTAYYGGRPDRLIMGIYNVILSVPSLLLAFVIMGMIGKGINAGIIALGIVYVPMLSRLTRSLTIVEKEKMYVEAARTLGCSDFRILFIHILPNCLSAIFAELTVDLAYAILDLAGLSFLGLGVQPPQSDWGYMLSDAQQFITLRPFQAAIPGILILVTVLSLNMLSSEVLAYTDPKQRKRAKFSHRRHYAGFLSVFRGRPLRFESGDER